MDIFKKENIKEASSWDWNRPRLCRKVKSMTRILHKKSRARLKQKLKRKVKEI